MYSEQCIVALSFFRSSYNYLDPFVLFVFDDFFFITNYMFTMFLSIVLMREVYVINNAVLCLNCIFYCG